jgi:hypothetical protein
LEPEKPRKPEKKSVNEAKKMCGMCNFKARGKWLCLYSQSYACPVNDTGVVCVGFLPKPRKPRPSQARPSRLAIPAGVKFIYFGRPRQGDRHQGVMTVAYSVHEKSQTIEMGYSFCSPVDNWIKAKGQDIALRRLNQRAVVANYLYDPRRLVLQITQAMMERKFDSLGNVLFTYPGDIEASVPSWSKDLARRLKARKVSRVPRLKLFERRSFGPYADLAKSAKSCVSESAPVPNEAWGLLGYLAGRDRYTLLDPNTSAADILAQMQDVIKKMGEKS